MLEADRTVNIVLVREMSRSRWLNSGRWILAYALLLALPLSHALAQAPDAGAAQHFPEPIEQSQALLVSQGTCEAGWRALGSGPQPHALAGGATLWIVPCALWSVNLESVVYAQLPAGGKAGDSLFQPVLFLDYDPYQGLHASNVTYNVSFDPLTGSLLSLQLFQSNGSCGSAARYDWNGGQQRFVVQKLLKNEVCNGGEKWEQVWPPLPPKQASATD